MTEEISLTENPNNRLILYRDKNEYVHKRRGFLFKTEPFLRGVGCGGIISDFDEPFIESTVRSALDAGSRIITPLKADGGKEFPLHPDISRKVQDYLDRTTH